LPSLGEYERQRAKFIELPKQVSLAEDLGTTAIGH
jgi:hypothetical protein